MIRLTAWVILLLVSSPAWAVEWVSIIPNSAYSRDIALGSSTVAQHYPPQSQGINPAGLICFPQKSQERLTIFVNPGGMWQTKNYFGDEQESPLAAQQAFDVARMITSGAAFRHRMITFAGFWSQPVMMIGDYSRYKNFESRTPLELHQNSAVLKLALHPRVSVGGRIDRYYSGAYPQDEGFSYGAILKPRGVRVGLQYQRFPSSGPRVWHPLDRRGDGTTTAGMSADIRNATVSVQVMNLTEPGKQAFLEPHAGIEWRPVRAVAIRAGGVSFSRSRKYAWSAGVGLVDANWLRSKSTRLSVPDDVVQFSMAMIYDNGRPVVGFSSLTVAWRF